VTILIEEFLQIEDGLLVAVLGTLPFLTVCNAPLKITQLIGFRGLLALLPNNFPFLAILPHLSELEGLTGAGNTAERLAAVLFYFTISWLYKFGKCQPKN
jgi:hypothetical protein